MKILLINGSPRKNGNTDQVSQAIKEIDSNLIIEDLKLRDLKMNLPDGCEDCAEGRHCQNVADEFEEKILPTIPNFDGFLLATPTHNNAVSSLMKIFIDRLACYTYSENDRIKNKKLALIIHGQANKSSFKFPIEWIKSVCKFMNLNFIGFYSFQSQAKVKTGKFDRKELRKLLEKF